VVKLARERHIDLKGVMSPPVFEGGIKTGINLLDLGTGQSHRMAKLRQSETGENQLDTIKWSFNPQIMGIGSEILRSSTPCELLVVDELGPLEFDRGQGWLTGLAAVDSGDFQSALIVIRPELLAAALKRWPDAVTLEIQSPDQVPDLLEEAVQLLGLPA
jgi:hypothetical protein